MKHPSPLEQGARVAVVSPAGPVTDDILADGLAILDSWKLDVELHPDVYETDDQRGYLAGSDDRRISALQSTLDAPDCDAIIFSRGGYGTMRLLPHLDFRRLQSHPIPLVGFSDLTALHLYVAGVLEVTTLHAPVVKSLRLHRRGSDTLEALRRALFGERSTPITVTGLDTVQSGTARGRLLGGNLTLVVSMLSTPFCPDLSNTILFLEETGEEDYRLDRMLTALRLSDKVGSPAGIVLGDFTNCEGTYIRTPQVESFVRSLAAEFDCPVAADLPVGHEHRNVALPMGETAELDADAGRLTIDTDLTGT